jgi:hypothetical protein
MGESGQKLEVFVQGASTLALAPVASDRFRFRKEVARDGTYVKNGQKFKITPDLRWEWKYNFDRMQENGVKVPVPLGHTFDPKANQGWVVSMDNDETSLFAVLEVVGEESADVVKKNDVSIHAVSNFVDGEGNQYGWCILHVALTSYPVLPGLKPPEAIAASFELEDNVMLKEVAEALACGEDKVLEVVQSLKLSHDETTGKLSEAEQQVADLTAKLQEKEAALELALKPPQQDPSLVALTVENRELKLSRLLATGKITTAVKDKLKALYAEPGSIQLSLDGKPSDFDKLVEILASNAPVPLGEHTPGQGNEPTVSPLMADAERRASAAKK